MKRLVLFSVACLMCMFTAVGQQGPSHEDANGNVITKPVDLNSLNQPMPHYTAKQLVRDPNRVLDLIDVVPGNLSTSGNGRAPQGGRLYINTKYIITGAEMSNAGFSGAVTSVGWQWNVPGAAAPPVSQSVETTGDLKVYLKDTTGTALGVIGTFVDTLGVGYTKIIDATITIPTGIEQIDIDVPVGGPGTSTYTYTPGNGVLLIFVYHTTTALSTPAAAPIVHCNTVYGASLLTYQSQTANGTTGTSSGFRPHTRFGGAPPLVDAVSVPAIYALGKLPIPYGVPQIIRAPIKNVSASLSGNVDVTLTVKQVVSPFTVRFTNTQTGIAMATNDTVIVSFPPWTPTIQEDDSVIVEVTSLAGETNFYNNRAVMVQNVNGNRFAYSQGSTPSGGVGFTGGTGQFVAKFFSASPAEIDSIQVNFASTATAQPYRLGIWDATGPGGSPGLNVYLSPGTYTSAPNLIATQAVSPAAFVDGFFYLGLQQTSTTNLSFAFQNEAPIRDSTFFSGPLNGAPGSWLDFASFAGTFRLMIEANIAQGTPMAYSTSTTTQNTISVLPGSTNQQVIGMEVVTTGNLFPVHATQFNLNTNGTTNPATDISNARIYYTGNSNTFAAINQFGSTVVSPNGSFLVTGDRALVGGTNYFWLTYDINPGATLNNVVDGEFTSVTVGGAQTPGITAPSGSRKIRTALVGTFTIGAPLFNRITGRSLYSVKQTRSVMREVPVPDATMAPGKGLDIRRDMNAVSFSKTELRDVDGEYNVLMENGKPVTGRLYAPLTDQLREELGLTDGVGDYATITAALADLNALGVAGPVNFMLLDATYPSETYPLTINVATNAPTATNTVTFKLNTGVTSTISASFAGSLFRILNTNYVTIDGSNTTGGTTRDLTLTNTSATSPGVIHIGSFGTTPVTNDVVKNCILNNGSQNTSAVVISDGNTLGAAGYFSDITIQNNSITKAFRGIFAIGGTTPPQHGFNLNIIANTMVDTGANAIRLNGVITQGVDGVVVRGNEFANFVSTNDENDRAIDLATGTNNAIVEKNIIHDLKYTGVNGFGAYGIAVRTAISTPSVIVKNNMIYNLSGDGDSYATFGGTFCPIGIYVFGTRQSGVNIYNNSINLYGNTLNFAGAYSIGICLDDTNSANVKNNVVKDSLGLLGATGVGAVAIALEINNTQLVSSDNNDFFSNSTGSGTNSVGKIGATDYATLATWQAASARDANSVSADPLYVGSTDLHITDPSSPASNAGTPLAAVTDDIDGDARSGSAPDIGADEFGGGGSVTLGVPVSVNWNIVSLPVSSPTPNDSVSNLYVNSVNAYAFAFTTAYQQRYTMANGPGYWIKSSTTYTQDITGTPRDTLTIPVLVNWNMIGSISTSIDTSAALVTPTPANLRASNYFRYNNGYVVTTSITPGGGYWVKANSAGSFFMHATGPAKPVDAPQAGRTIEDLHSITIRDANGGSQTLYFGADANGEIPVNMFAMPPAPPVGSFDARFVSTEGGLMAQTHAAEVSEVIELPIAIQSSAPTGLGLTVSWNVKGTSTTYELSDGSGWSHPVRGEGSVRISTGEQLILKVTGGGTLPKEFALSQNYPNPFNPTTNIKYALPVDSKVMVEIYNVLGQNVKTLFSGDKPAGYHVAEWDGTGNQGQPLGTSVYFLQFSATGANGKTFSEVKKLMMLK